MKVIGKMTFQEYLETFKDAKSYRKQAWRYFIKNNMMKCGITGVNITRIKIRTSHGQIHHDFFTEDGRFCNLDHIKPIILGKCNRKWNLQPTIAKANYRKANKFTEKDKNKILKNKLIFKWVMFKRNIKYKLSLINYQNDKI